jgi:hypothetical protein
MKARRKRPMVVNFTCSREEYEAIQILARETTCRSFSEYARKVLMGKPVVVTIRNRSLDDLIDVLTGIYANLEGLGARPSWGPKEREEVARVLEMISSTVFKIIEQCMPIQN